MDAGTPVGYVNGLGGAAGASLLDGAMGDGKASACAVGPFVDARVGRATDGFDAGGVAALRASQPTSDRQSSTAKASRDIGYGSGGGSLSTGGRDGDRGPGEPSAFSLWMPMKPEKPSGSVETMHNGS